VITLQGEVFRPSNVEKVVDDMLKEFMEQIGKFNEEEYKTRCDVMMHDMNTLSRSLAVTTYKLFNDKMYEELTGDATTFRNIHKHNSLKEFKEFADNKLLKIGSRVTVEVFSKAVTAEEASFKLDAGSAFGNKEYAIIDLNFIAGLKEKRPNLKDEFGI